MQYKCIQNLQLQSVADFGTLQGGNGGDREEALVFTFVYAKGGINVEKRIKRPEQ
jgi:hypothetical protein